MIVHLAHQLNQQLLPVLQVIEDGAEVLARSVCNPALRFEFGHCGRDGRLSSAVTIHVNHAGPGNHCPGPPHGPQLELFGAVIIANGNIDGGYVINAVGVPHYHVELH